MSATEEPVDGLRRAFLYRVRQGAVAGACVPPDRIWEAARGELPKAEIMFVVEHTASCPACAAAWRLARDLSPERTPAVAPARFAQRLSAFAAHPWLLAAAASVLLAAAGLFILRIQAERVEPPAYRLSEGRPVRSLLQAERALPRSACTLRWDSDLPGARYAVFVTDEDLDPIASATGLERGEFTVPATALAALPPGARLLWRVEATLPEGRRVTSPTFLNRLE